MYNKRASFFLIAIAALIMLSVPVLFNLPSFASAVSGLKPLPITSTPDYFRLFSDDIEHHITVFISRDEWDGMMQDMAEYSKQDARMRTGNYRKADMLYEDEYGSIKFFNIGFRTRGNTTRRLTENESGEYQRAHFAIKFNETFDYNENSPEYAYLKNREFCDIDKLNLKWNLWVDYSHIRELYCFDRLRQAGIAAPNAALAALKINIDGTEIDYGVYTMIEPIDKDFLTKRFGKNQNDGNLYKCLWEDYCPATLEDNYPAEAIGVKDWKANYRPSYDLKTNEQQPDFNDIITFIENINALEGEEFYKYIEQNFEIDRFLRLMALNVLLGTPDDYRTMGNNYYLYFNNYGKIEYIPYDYDASLGCGWSGEPYWTFQGIAEADIYKWYSLTDQFLEEDIAHPLTDKILKNNEYRKKYEAYLAYFIESELFSYKSFTEMFEKQKSIFSGYVCSETADYGEEMLLSNEEWYFNEKINSVKSQLISADSRKE